MLIHARAARTAGLVLLLVALATCFAVAVRQSPGRHPRTGTPFELPGSDGAVTLLHNGWRISPAGRHLRINDLPLGGAISPDGKLLAIVTAGWSPHTLQIVDLDSEKSIASLPMGRAWNGIAWSPDGERLYIAGGVSNARNDVHVVAPGTDSAWTQVEGFRLTGPPPRSASVAGLALSRDGRVLYVANLADNCVYALDTHTGSTLGRVDVGGRPVAMRLLPGGTRLAVANWAASQVTFLDITDAASPRIAGRHPVGDHPNDIAVSADGRLFVCCGNDDSVRVLDAQTGAALETVKTAMTPRAPPGSTPTALALSPDGSRLYVANSDNNCVCVVDVRERGRSRVLGFVPTGWYPSALHVSPDGRRLIVGIGKGTGTGPNPSTPPINPNVPTGFTYIARQLHGLLSFVDVPSPELLARMTRQVIANSPYRDEYLSRPRARARCAVPDRVGARSPIRYVLYIIKENRTYDQVLGDLPRGNGDPSLCLFGREVTPNHHALAEEFVLLDNLYCAGEVSEDGHPWSTSANVTDFVTRSWVLGYSGKGRPPGGNALTDPKAGFIWDACRRKGLSVRSYGEYAGHPSLEGASSDAYVGKVRPGEKPPGRDTERADIFIREFQEFERSGSMPRFMVMSLGEDHTTGTSPGTFTPKACVASNDLALGRIVECVSKSRLWSQFAIFVIEDDAQNGPDHVDSHRTVGLVISPYARRRAVDSTFYTTNSMLRTMELILGLPPLTQYDAAATPMFASFTDKADLRPYTALPARVDLNARNAATAYGAARSARMDWSEYDKIDEDALNRILWHSIRGAQAPYPAPVRRALPEVTAQFGGD